MDKKSLKLVAVIGCPRSGTTLMQAQLSRRFCLKAIAETHFISLFSKFLFLWGSCRTVNSRKRLLDAIQEFTKVRWGIISGYNKEKVRQMTLLSTLEKTEVLAGESHSYQMLLQNVFFHHARDYHVDGVIEKFSYYNAVDVEYLASLFPEMKFIHVIRDGRDVSLSWRKTWFGPKTVRKSAELWQDHVKCYSEWGKHNQDRYIEVQFQDLIEDEDRVIHTLSNFIGLQLKDASFDNNKLFDILAEKKHYENSKYAPDKSYKSRWPEEMSEKERLVFENVAADAMTQYSFFGQEGKRETKRKIKEYGIELKDYLFGSTTWKRRMMLVLPIVIWLAQLNGLSVYNMLSKFKKD